MRNADGEEIASCAHGREWGAETSKGHADAVLIAEYRTLAPELADALETERACTDAASRLVVDCLEACGVDVAAVALAPYNADALNTMRRGLPERIRDLKRERDAARAALDEERARHAETSRRADMMVEGFSILRRCADRWRPAYQEYVAWVKRHAEEMDAWNREHGAEVDALGKGGEGER